MSLGFLSVIWYALRLGPQAGALWGDWSTSKFVFWLQTNEWLFDYWHATRFSKYNHIGYGGLVTRGFEK